MSERDSYGITTIKSWRGRHVRTRFEGVRCPTCERPYMPPRRVCLNPEVHEESVIIETHKHISPHPQNDRVIQSND